MIFLSVFKVFNRVKDSPSATWNLIFLKGFMFFLQYCRDLYFKEEPSYDHLIDIFVSYHKKLNIIPNFEHLF